PTREMIMGLRAVDALPFVDVPFLAADLAVKQFLQENGTAHVIKDELNYDHYRPDQPPRFVFQGCYSSHMRMKQRNYRDETLLTVAEKFGALAELLTGYRTPTDSLREAWKIVLFNQFHDLLPGTAIHRAFEDAHTSYDRAERALVQSLDAALDSLTEAADYPQSGYPIIVFNALGHPRTDVANVILDFDRLPAQILFVDAAGDTTPGQVLEGMQVYERFWRVRVGFAARQVPAVGYKAYAVKAWDKRGRDLRVLDVLREPTLAAWHPEIFDDHTYWKPAARLFKMSLDTTRQGQILLGGQALKAELDLRTGGIVRLVGPSGKNWALASQPMARLEILGDEPGGYTAWKMRLTDFDTLLTPAGPVRLLTDGPVCTKVRVPYSFGNSRFYVDVTVYRELPRVDVDVHSYWRERLKVLKAVFPVATQAAQHTRAIPFATIQRPNDGLEEPAQRWMDLSDTAGGVAILNRNNPGHDVQGHTIRVTLLRSPVDPDPVADVGEHHARLAIYPHSGTWQQADPQAQALALSAPLLTRVPHHAEGRIPPQASLAAVSNSAVTLSAFKKSEDGRGYVMRLVERSGKKQPSVRVDFLEPIASGQEVDLIEDPLGPAATRGSSLVTSLGPYEIKTCRVVFERR
ncbi:MAG TPA: hypothetical protein ENK07_11540, partial [Bacteroidetes bacterium]|nr:hypothetical protein [Bacteroidota bacterium]